jgi:SAM-dependent methyltransferase
LGYQDAKFKFINATLADLTTMLIFKSGSKLPQGFGVSFDERCVEYAWTFSHLEPEVSESVLDAGSALNHASIVEEPVLRNKALHILTLAPEGNCFWSRGISYIYADLRSIPVRDAFYDTVICISTLEHVGCDNSKITGKEAHRAQGPDDYLTAIREMRRVLRPGGTLFLTVPFGVRRHFGTFRQFDEPLLSTVIEAFGPHCLVQNFYKYSADGWNTATASDCSACEYVDWVATVWQGRPWPELKPIEPDGAAAARAVACLLLVKH